MSLIHDEREGLRPISPSCRRWCVHSQTFRLSGN